MITGLMLESTSTSLLIEERRISDIVIGVPHHAPAGVEELPCGRVSDENAGYLGRYIAEKLDCCSVIACNDTLDENKYADSDYTKQIIKWNPSVLVEIHGHANNKANYDIEISSGSLENEKYSTKLAGLLAGKLSDNVQLKKLSISGEYDRIFYQASKTATITNDRWIAYHIELPTIIRMPVAGDNGKPPQLGYQFCDCLVEALNEMNLHAS